VSSHANEGGSERCAVYKKGNSPGPGTLLFPHLASASLLSPLKQPTPPKWPSLENGKQKPRRDTMTSASFLVGTEAESKTFL